MTDSRTTESFDGVQIVYDVSGSDQDAPMIVFIHGWTCNRIHWREQVAAFSDRYRVIAIDLAGHGDSSLGRIEYSMPSFAKDVEAVLDKENVSRAVLVGHSMGGMVILHAARLLGQRVVGVIGADTFKYMRDDPRTGKQAEQAQYIANDYENAMKAVVSNMFSETCSEELKSSITDGMVGIAPEVAIGAMMGMAEDEPLFEMARDLSIPKFAINASGRPMDELAVKEAGIELKLLPTTGHFVMNEDPVGFNQLLTEALEQIFPEQA